MIPDYLLSRLPEAREILSRALASNALSPDLVDTISTFLVTGSAPEGSCRMTRPWLIGDLASDIPWFLLHSALSEEERMRRVEHSMSALKQLLSSSEYN